MQCNLAGSCGRDALPFGVQSVGRLIMTSRLSVVCAYTMQFSYNNSNVPISAVCPLQSKQTQRPSRRAGIALGPEGNPVLVGIRAGPRP